MPVLSPLDSEIVIDVNPEDPDLKPISELETYKLLTKFLKKSLGPNDFPKRIFKEFKIELALPFCDIINCALKSGIFPDAFKISEIHAHLKTYSFHPLVFVRFIPPLVAIVCKTLIILFPI